MRWLSFLFISMFCATLHAQPASQARKRIPVSAKPSLDHSGEVRRGKASFYGKEFYGRLMADGTRMNPRSNIAASRTLPFGTKAVVKNLANGKSEVVEIKDRGPYVAGRIIDVSPAIADKLGMLHHGVVQVEVQPLHVPQPDGSIKLGVAAQNHPEWMASGE
jgi:rare lipoprotein A